MLSTIVLLQCHVTVKFQQGCNKAKYTVKYSNSIRGTKNAMETGYLTLMKKRGISLQVFTVLC